MIEAIPVAGGGRVVNGLADIAAIGLPPVLPQAERDIQRHVERVIGRLREQPLEHVLAGNVDGGKLVAAPRPKPFPE